MMGNNITNIVKDITRELGEVEQKIDQVANATKKFDSASRKDSTLLGGAAAGNKAEAMSSLSSQIKNAIVEIKNYVSSQATVQEAETETRTTSVGLKK